MVEKNIGLKTLKYIIKDIVLDVLYWPWWWFSEGVLEAFFRMKDTIADGNKTLALTVWVKNILVPMYGDYSLQGRFVSFIMRIVQIIGRSILFSFWIIFAFFVFLLWIFLPLFLLYEFLFNLNLFTL